MLTAWSGLVQEVCLHPVVGMTLDSELLTSALRQLSLPQALKLAEYLLKLFSKYTGAITCSFCPDNDCFGSLGICFDVEVRVLRHVAAARMQWLLSQSTVLAELLLLEHANASTHASLQLSSSQAWRCSQCWQISRTCARVTSKKKDKSAPLGVITGASV